MQIQVRSGSKVLRTFVYDLAVEPFKTAGSYELLLEEAGLPVGKLKVTVASPTKRSPNPAYTATLERLGEPRRIARGSFLATASPQTITLVFPTFRTIYPAVTYDLLVTTGMETVTAATNPASAQTGRGFRLALASQTPGGNQSLTLSLAPAVPGNRVSTPGGIGHATGFARSNGQVRLRGLLGDGQVFSATLLLTPYRDKMSYLGGIVTIGDLAVPERSETAGAEEAGLKWKREPDPRAKSYPNGFGPLDLSALASRWYAMRSAEALAQSLGLEFRIFEVRYVAPTMDVLPARWSLRDNYTLLPVFPPQLSGHTWAAFPRHPLPSARRAAAGRRVWRTDRPGPGENPHHRPGAGERLLPDHGHRAGELSCCCGRWILWPAEGAEYTEGCIAGQQVHSRPVLCLLFVP